MGYSSKERGQVGTHGNRSFTFNKIKINMEPKVEFVFIVFLITVTKKKLRDSTKGRQYLFWLIVTGFLFVFL